jgi:hypothetical protein
LAYVESKVGAVKESPLEIVPAIVLPGTPSPIVFANAGFPRSIPAISKVVADVSVEKTTA